ncbi:hypothetical protein [Zobellia laminariae]|uniref:hypothetical protein n=1 Tax=Zobellia laminariae TaxID=248906 RepID=UPI003EF1F24B
MISATNPGNGSLLTSIDMLCIGADVNCACGIRMETSDRTVKGCFLTYIFRTNSHTDVSYVTFN